MWAGVHLATQRHTKQSSLWPGEQGDSLAEKGRVIPLAGDTGAKHCVKEGWLWWLAHSIHTDALSKTMSASLKAVNRCTQENGGLGRWRVQLCICLESV